MWEQRNHQWGDARKNAAAQTSSSSHTMVHEIHVMLVDHDSEALIHTAKMLETCRYRVSLVELASAAISMLISGKAKFDIVMANINSPDLHGFKLLQQSVAMGIPIVLMSNEDNTYMATRALESGAFLYLKKPATMDVIKCLWQHALREKTRMIREREIVGAANRHGSRGVEFRNSAMNPQRVNQENPNNLESMFMMKNKGKMKSRGRDGDFGESEYESPHMMKNNSNVKRKMCTEWTQELHAKFMKAVEQLGEGKCFPKEILELMGVSSLTRMQVASHLQKCRNDNWRSPLERKSQTIHPAPTDNVHRPRRFGSKPQLGKTGRLGPDGLERGSETKSEQNNGTHLHMGNGSTSMANTAYHHHHHHHYGAMGAGPNSAPPRANVSRHSADHEFINFQDVDRLIQNGPGLNQPNPTPETYHHFGPSYRVQNSGGASMESKTSPWSSDTSNFESEQSESR